MQYLLDFLRKWESKGKRELLNGTKLICPVPHIAPQAWLHQIYAQLSELQIIELEKELPISLPKDFKDFLSHANGINIFSDSLSIWGLRNSYVRTGDEAIQPYSLSDLNAERPRGCPDSWLFFGSYSWDGSRVMFDLKEGIGSNNKVYLCLRNSTIIIKEWSSLWDWVIAEVERLGRMYDENGVVIDDNMPTSPVY